MKKFILLCLVATACSTKPATPPDGAPLPPPPMPPTPVEGSATSPLSGTTSQADSLELKIKDFDRQINHMQREYLQHANLQNANSQVEAQRIRRKIHDLEQQKARLELQLMSLPGK